jgi:hypothetical protein
MITIPVRVARACLGVFRRLPTHRSRDAPQLGVVAGPTGLRLRFNGTSAAAEYQHNEPCAEAAFCVPLAVLDVKPGSPVVLDPSGGTPAGDVPRFPPWPDSHADNGPELIVALAEAARTAAREPSRFALTGVLLRGAAGSVVATDGRQLLIHSGFRFGWTEDLFVPALKVFDSKELRGRPVWVGCGNESVLIRAGCWTVALKAEAGARYPDFGAVIPRKEDVRTSCKLAPADVEAILEALPRLPGLKEKGSPVTLELGRVCRLVAGEGEETGEVPFVSSACRGRAARVVMDRNYLGRALRLGFDTLHLTAPEKPILCRDERRTYVWMPLDADPERQETPVPEPHANGRPAEPAPPAATDPLAEAEAVRDLLGEAQSRLGRLVSALKQHRRQARAVQAAVASLRHLPPFAP